MLHYAKDLVVELTPPHVYSAWGFKAEMVRVAGLAVCCIYFSKKKKSYVTLLIFLYKFKLYLV